MKYLLYCLCISFLIVSCKGDSDASKVAPKVQKPRVKIPAFQKDNAYEYVQKQLEFGNRVPGTEAHKACKNYLVSALEDNGMSVHVQSFDAKFHTGEVHPGYNIIASINPDKKQRIFLGAHWDSRRIGEEDKDVEMRDKPIAGADDGGSGVGVLLEISRVLKENPIDLGVDIIFFDAEDQGERGRDSPRESWCLGSQYWAKNLYPANYTADYGILLDMVGAEGATFRKDLVSRKYAPQVQEKIWGLANQMGYANYFVNEFSNEVTDDHYFVNLIAGLPMIDIINQKKKSNVNFDFGDHWHTHDDDISVISKETLRVVGQVVTAALYKESDGSL